MPAGELSTQLKGVGVQQESEATSGAVATAVANWGLSSTVVESGPGALATLPAIVASLGQLDEIGLLLDGVGKTDRQGADLVATVQQLLPPGSKTRIITATGGPHGTVLDEATVEASISDAQGISALISIGSGTVTDLAKKVAHTLGIPVVVVQTAASVNGFSDPLSVLVQKGAKRTVPTVWPTALIVDFDILSAAPVQLTRSGVGDAVAIWVAPADWYLACALGLDSGFDAGLLSPVVDAAAALSGDEPTAPKALASLADTLTLGGLGIGIAGTTAGLSGCEHLISHLLDMAAMAEGGEHDLHGAQVGVASVVSSALWEIALDELGIGQLDVSTLVPPADLASRVEASWIGLDPSGQLGAECLAAVEKKFEKWSANQDSVRAFFADWPKHETALRVWAREPEIAARTLANWGASRTFAELQPPVDPARARWALRSLPFMRDRFTLVDLLLLAGLWTDDLLDRILDRAAVAGGGL